MDVVNPYVERWSIENELEAKDISEFLLGCAAKKTR